MAPVLDGASLRDLRGWKGLTERAAAEEIDPENPERARHRMRRREASDAAKVSPEEIERYAAMTGLTAEDIAGGLYWIIDNPAEGGLTLAARSMVPAEPIDLALFVPAFTRLEVARARHAELRKAIASEGTWIRPMGRGALTGCLEGRLPWGVRPEEVLVVDPADEEWKRLLVLGQCVQERADLGKYKEKLPDVAAWVDDVYPLSRALRRWGRHTEVLIQASGADSEGAQRARSGLAALSLMTGRLAMQYEQLINTGEGPAE